MRISSQARVQRASGSSSLLSFQFQCSSYVQFPGVDSSSTTADTTTRKRRRRATALRGL